MIAHCQLTVNSTHVFFMDSYHAYMLEYQTETWTELDSPFTSRIYPSCGLINSPENGLEVVTAGYGTSEIYNVNDDLWRDGPEETPYFYVAGFAQLEDTFVVVGGHGPDEWEYLDSVYVFDNVDYEWDLLDQRLAIPRSDYPGVVAVTEDFLNC